MIRGREGREEIVNGPETREVRHWGTVWDVRKRSGGKGVS